MVREFFFLKDNISNKFYTGRQVGLSDFESAAVYYNERNAIKAMKKMVHSWDYENELTSYRMGELNDYTLDMIREIELRKDVENWGIQIVKGRCKI